MAFVSNSSSDLRSRRGLLSRLNGLMEALSEASHGAACAKRAYNLSQLSDEALAKRGIRREDIVRHAFKGTLWI